MPRQREIAEEERTARQRKTAEEELTAHQRKMMEKEVKGHQREMVEEELKSRPREIVEEELEAAAAVCRVLADEEPEAGIERLVHQNINQPLLYSFHEFVSQGYLLDPSSI